MNVIKRNNPCNIRTSVRFTWRGELPGVVAPDYAQFDTPENGYRAALLNMNTYITKHKANTINKIIKRWDPKKDSADDITPDEYVKKVSDETGIAPDTVITAGDYDTMGKIALAMTHVEHKELPADSVLQAAIEKAKGTVTGIISVVKKHPVATVVILLLFFYLVKN